jgi:hypothetical protein
MISYHLVADRCRIIASRPTTPPPAAATLLMAAKLLEEQAKRCMELAVKLERAPL